MSQAQTNVQGSAKLSSEEHAAKLADHIAKIRHDHFVAKSIPANATPEQQEKLLQDRVALYYESFLLLCSPTLEIIVKSHGRKSRARQAA